MLNQLLPQVGINLECHHRAKFYQGRTGQYHFVCHDHDAVANGQSRMYVCTVTPFRFVLEMFWNAKPIASTCWHQFGVSS